MEKQIFTIQIYSQKYKQKLITQILSGVSVAAIKFGITESLKALNLSSSTYVDLCNREVVRFAISKSNNTELVL